MTDFDSLEPSTNLLGADVSCGQQDHHPLKSFGIEYIFLAEFDIDKGSIIKVQYPSVYPHASEYSIASMMLPDGSHNCVEDTTIFFLRGSQQESEQQTLVTNHDQGNNLAVDNLSPTTDNQDDFVFVSNMCSDQQKEKTQETPTDDIFYHVLNVQKQKKYEGSYCTIA